MAHFSWSLFFCIHFPMTHTGTAQKSVTRPFLSQSPYLVGSGPRGPPISPVIGLTSLGKRSRGSCSPWGCLSSSSPSHFSSSFPAGVFPLRRLGLLFEVPALSSEWCRTATAAWARFCLVRPRNRTAKVKKKYYYLLLVLVLLSIVVFI